MVEEDLGYIYPNKSDPTVKANHRLVIKALNKAVARGEYQNNPETMQRFIILVLEQIFGKKTEGISEHRIGMIEKDDPEFVKATLWLNSPEVQAAFPENDFFIFAS
mmetsp:Transcript_23078/g.22484  ORF Transcript_23078/g.22484 Transcript_23078/m.22484 type:complete len:106 (+) Transcript_23078:2154-2471(+)